jgi:putative ABC transport system ATP-binding protein
MLDSMTHNKDVQLPREPAPDPFIRLRGVSKSYGADARRFVALDAITLDISAGECVAVVGKSGSGKTTLINLLTGIDSPTTGAIHVGPHAIHQLSQEGLAAWRGRNVGIVFQFFQLLPTLTIAENVMLPMDFCHMFPRHERRDRALALLARLDILSQADKVPADLSGGQQQRAAIARALANDPPLIVADEPTGNLDTVTSADVMAFLSSLAQDGKTVITVSHERELDRYFNRVISLRDGVVTDDSGALQPVNA